MCETVFDKTCRKCTHILFVRPHQLSRADASVSRDRLTNSFTTKALHQRGATVHLLVRPSFRFFRFHFLSHNSPISRFCPSDDASYGERARTPVPNTNRDVVVVAGRDDNVFFCTSRVALVLGRRSRAWRSIDTATRARASAVSPSPSPSIDRSQNVESARRRRERREFGGFFLISHFSTMKRIARVAGTSSSSRWTPVRVFSLTSHGRPA